uniref:GPN-loop GTPase n=1 Tax=Blastobotrys adeninivorans TaxID=409370 RepID=A0A060T8P5_BLAAD
MPVNVICIGMAGSGKTTFVQRLNSHLHSVKKPPYVMNLDPAVKSVPFGTNIDIRDAINYKKVMSEYNLGPNGAIMTSLNLFATKIDQVLGLVEKRKDQVEHVVVDTPGQIEVFIWSASGAIITDALASAFPTVIAYIVDTPRSSSPATFMSNMLYACSILYKTKLPMIVVFNKTDVKDAEFAKEWMQDFELFQQVLRESEDDENGEGSGYMGSLINSLSLMLEEFYRHLDVVGVSAYTGDGFDDFLEAVDNKVEEYNRDYKAERERIIKAREEEAAKKKTQDLAKLMKDIGIKDDKGKAKETGQQPGDTVSDVESEDEDEEASGIVDTDALDEFEVTREHNFPDRRGEINDDTEKSIQDRYQQALKESRQEEQLEKFLQQVRRS